VYYKDLFLPVGVAELCRLIRDATLGYRVVSTRIDPAAWVEDPVTRVPAIYEYWKNGVLAQKAVKDLVNGIPKVQAALAVEPAIVSFTPACVRTLWEIQRYAWDQRPGHENRPIDVDDHCMECLYRCEMQDPRWSATEGGANPVEDIAITKPEIETSDLDFSLD
jgi:hypothetical protein